VHPSLTGGPALVHVDAYRLQPSPGAPLELDDLDLDASLEDAVTVVEWGTGLAEALATDRLEVEVTRAHGGESTSEARTLRVVPVGSRWDGVDLEAVLGPVGGPVVAPEGPGSAPEDA
jgi:tRNA threonylcarbamoyladenosine biosynthesis protein TsaE